VDIHPVHRGEYGCDSARLERRRSQRIVAHPGQPTHATEYRRPVNLGIPLPKTGEFEQVIMIAVGIEEMAGSD
jgi:hypothetical protein